MVEFFSNKMFWLFIILIIFLLFLIIIFIQARLYYKVISGSIGEMITLRNLHWIRFDKMDKKPVIMVSMHKTGSTLLSYLCALINTKNSIKNFRNDFDIIPFLSIRPRWFAQNFNARQEGKYQMYKINGQLEYVEAALKAKGVKKIIWSSREFNGWYCCLYSWGKKFLPTFHWRLFLFKFTSWNLFKWLTLRLLAKQHVEDLWYAYNGAISSNVNDFIFLSYEYITKEKEATIKLLSRWLGINMDEEVLHAIMEKTTKVAMSVGDRFDPQSFGEYKGTSKVNLDSRNWSLDEADMKIYDSIFKKRFSKIGIMSYSQLINDMNQWQTKRLDSLKNEES